MKLTAIYPNPKNPRTIKDDRFKKMVASIKEFPAMMPLRPIVVDKDGMILGGNMRFKALKELGMKEIPDNWVKSAEGLTEDEQKRFIVEDNLQFGDWDEALLSEDYSLEDLQDWGVELESYGIEPEPKEAADDGYEEPDEIKTDIVLGDLFTIGNHRLLCGDSTSATDVEKLMAGEKAESLFTSPPYSDMRTYEEGTDVSIDKLIEFIPTFHPYTNFQVVNLGIQRKDNEVVQYWDEYIAKAKSCGLKLLSWNVWDKMNAGSISNQNAMFAIVHEWIFVFGEHAKELNRTIPNKDKGRVNDHISRRQVDGKLRKAKSYTIGDYHQLDTIIHNHSQKERDEFTIKHPAVFPVALPFEYIQAMTNETEIVSDPFLGSGTTMVAAHQLDRRCFGMEIAPRYCQIIIDRMKALDPNIVITRNGKPHA